MNEPEVIYEKMKKSHETIEIIETVAWIGPKWPIMIPKIS